MIAGHSSIKVTEEYTFGEIERQDELPRAIQGKLAETARKENGAAKTEVPCRFLVNWAWYSGVATVQRRRTCVERSPLSIVGNQIPAGAWIRAPILSTATLPARASR